MKVLSLFDGAACAMVCLKRAGIPIDVYYSADIKKCAVRCEELVAEYYGVKQIQLGDVTQIDYSQLPHIDLLCAGFPCQDYSVVNSKKQGINGKNGQLFWEVVRAIKAVKPKYIILENVTTIPEDTLKMIQRETGCFENRIVDPVALGWATRRKRLFFTNWLSWLDQPVPRATKETLEELLDDDAKVVKRLDRHGLHDVNEMPSCQIQGQALTPNGKRHKEGCVIGVVNRSRERLVFSTTEIATLVQNQPTRAGEGVFILTDDPSKTPYRRVKTENMYKAGYTAFRCPTQAELARFHTYPVEIMEQFTPAHAQSLMGDGWHCGSIQWLFDKLKKVSS